MEGLKRKVQVWVFSKDEHCLLLKTNKKRGSFWQPITGSVEPEEYSDSGWETAAQREFAEETGFSAENAFIDTKHSHQFESQWGGKVLEKTFATMKKKQEKPRIDPKEHESFQWISAKEAVEKIQFPSNVDGLKAAFQSIFKKPLLLFCIFLSLSAPSYAAQMAKILTEVGYIRAEPEENAEILEAKKNGDELKISSESKDGWFKTKTADGRYGWIHQAQVLPRDYKSSLDIANINPSSTNQQLYEKRDHEAYNYTYGLKLSLGYNSVISPKLNSYVGSGSFSTLSGYNFGAQVAFYKSPLFGVTVRAERLAASGSSTLYSISYSSIPIHVGGEWTIEFSQKLSLLLGVALGYSANTTIDLQDKGTLEKRSIKGSPISLLPHVELDYAFSKLFRAYIETSFRYADVLLNKKGNYYVNDQKVLLTDDELITYGSYLKTMTFVLNAGVKFTF